MILLGDFMDKKKRREAILKLISENEIETQAQLVEKLAEIGISVGQATVSRDIRELKLSKKLSENDVNCYFFEDSDADTTYNSIFAQSVISIDHAQNIVVLRCHPGLANAACKAVDDREFGSVVGTIAGDDTVFILTKTENHAISLMSALNKMMSK